MTPVLGETLITLEDAAKLAPGYRPGRCASVAAVRRWAMVGMRGTRLETAIAGGRRCTSREALLRFFERLTAARDGAPERRPRAPRRALDAARRALKERHGIEC